MLRKFFLVLICIFAISLYSYSQCPNNEIWYTTTDDKVANYVDYNSDEYIIYNEYVDGKGVIRLEGKGQSAPIAITYLGYEREGVCVVAFKDCTNLETITMPNSVRAIKEGAFDGCSGLKSITLPSGVEDLYSMTLRGCSSLEAFKGKFASNDHRCLIVDGNLIAIAPAGLNAYTIPSRVVSIAPGVFANCGSLSSVIIPNGVNEIGDGVFSGCVNLHSFGGKYASSDGRCLVKGGAVIAFAPAGLTEYTIPGNVTKIGNNAFEGCAAIERIAIHDGVTDIGWEAFVGCLRLREVVLPNTITEIPHKTFKGCSSLEEVVIPESVTNIGSRAFEGCSGILSITLPKSVLSVGNHAFDGCDNLKSVVIASDRFQAGWIDLSGIDEVVVSPNVTQLAAGALLGLNGSLTVDFKSITKENMSGLNVAELTLGDGVEYIDLGVFSDWNSLTTFKGKYSSADGRCLVSEGLLVGVARKGLTSIVIPDGVSTVPSECFEGCVQLTDVVIPNSVTEIGDRAFKGCISLKRVTLTDGITRVGDSLFEGCESLGAITIPDGVTEIGYQAFKNCKSIESIVIPDSVVSIGDLAFRYCSSLTKLTIPNTTKVADKAFTGCSITDITLSTVTGDMLTSAGEIKQSKVKAYTGKNASADGRCLINNGTLVDFLASPDITTYVVPNGITTIGAEVFRACKYLTSVTLPDSVTSIEDRAFMNCVNLKELYIGGGVVTIGEEAFKNCAYIATLTLPKGVVSIGERALENCYRLTQLNCEPLTPPVIGLLGIPDTTMIYVPKEAFKLYGKAEGWSELKERIERAK